MVTGVRFFGICLLAQPEPARIKQCDKRVSRFFVAGSQWYAADLFPWHVASGVHVSESNQAERLYVSSSTCYRHVLL